MTNKVDLNDYKGMSLFKDIEDAALRTRNRAVIMVNILEDSYVKGKITAKGAGLILGYFNEIPKEEQEATRNEFVIQSEDRGFTTI